MTYEERLSKIEEFKASVKDVSQWYPGLSKLVDEIIDYVLDDTNPLPNTSIPNYSCYYVDDLLNILNSPKDWDDYDKRILRIISIPKYWNNTSSTSSFDSYFNVTFFNDYVSRVLQADDCFNILLQKKELLGLNESQFLQSMINYVDTDSWYISEKELSSFGKYILGKAQNNLSKLVTFFNSENDFILFELLLNHDKHFTKDKYGEFLEIRPSDFKLKEISTFSVDTLLKKNSELYESLILDKIPKITDPINLGTIFFLLRKYLPEKYNSKLEEHSFLFLQSLKPLMIKKGNVFNYRVFYINPNLMNDGDPKKNLLIYSSEVLSKSSNVYYFDFIVDFFESCPSFYDKEVVLSAVFPNYKEQFLPVFFDKKNQPIGSDYHQDDFYRTFFKILPTINYHEYEPNVWELTKHKSKKIRELAAVTLSKLGEKAIPSAEKLLSEKKADSRQTAALILSLIKTDKSQEILMNAIDSEKDDNTRDTMLEGISGLLPTHFSPEELAQKVQKAADRGKLDKPLDWWLDETKIPSVYWKNSNKSIDNQTIRFLFYRMSRTKDIRTDIEAKPLILMIDRNMSGDFAKGLIKTYFDNGADAKYKFCLTLAGLLGDEEIIDLMKRKVNEFAEGSRGKMAEYVVKALALQGSTKALRAVEFFSRKYKNKNKNIGAAAIESFEIAAEELGITPYDLADSIIPDFGFDGLFREFEAGGESYRAFINTDFKIAFFNEDNKLSKSPPKSISKELAEEFKEITKEIKDIVKSQSGRLEQYLVIQRKWQMEKWQDFFMNNPVMFVYATRLIWGAFDTTGKLQFTFRCEQDQTLLNQDGEEVEIDENLNIGMVHPIDLSSDAIEYWNENLYESNLEPIFPQLRRTVVALKTSDQNLNISNEFSGIKLSGYTFVSRLEKMGWFRGSVIDGGGISSYYKDFSELGITAIVTQIGSISIGYLEEDAEIDQVMFVKKGQVAFGSYSYDEPQNSEDARLVKFGQVPTIVFSEVMADMQALKIIAEAKK